MTVTLTTVTKGEVTHHSASRYVTRLICVSLIHSKQSCVVPLLTCNECKWWSVHLITLTHVLTALMYSSNLLNHNLHVVCIHSIYSCVSIGGLTLTAALRCAHCMLSCYMNTDYRLLITLAVAQIGSLTYASVHWYQCSVM
jgi:hypothetical protein